MSTHIPRKRFGQNFLEDQAVIADIVSCIDPRADDAMVEIGPGLAALTTPLLAKLDVLHAVEIDRDIVARLSGRFAKGKLIIHNADALKYDFAALAREIAPGGQIRLVGNLPYNISTPLLFHLASYAELVRDCHFMLQNEVVLRMVAEPACADYGRLSVMLQYHFHMEKLLDVPPEAFNPPPKVDSAIVRMIPRPYPLPASNVPALERLVAQAFGQRRKTLRNNLKGVVDDALFEQLGIDSSIRPENLSVHDYVRLSNALAV
ncbi:ribosomal RNA small subunit methyltransferase A [Chitinimonas naiadis]